MRDIHSKTNQAVPLPFKVKKPVLALGSSTNNTLCFAAEDTAYLSRVHPDLSAPQDLADFEQDAKYFLKRKPRIIACDLHPEYASTKYAHQLRDTNDERRTTNDGLWTIQHHHAHIASCMGENGLKNQRVIGVAFDGTGLGSDNTIWGGEFLVCDYRDFQRKAHLAAIPLLGGEAAVREPWRLAAAWLYAAYQQKFLRLGIGFTRKIDRKKWAVLEKMYRSGFNSPLASSMGRLFDAAASIILEKYRARSQAELAIGLERTALSCRGTLSAYSFRVIKNHLTVIASPERSEGRSNRRGFEIASSPSAPRNDYIVILDPLPMFRQIVSDIKSGVAREDIAYRFHLTVAEMTRKTCMILSKENKINSVVLSGGVFQNSLLLSLCLDLLYKQGFRVYRHKRLSCGDAGISLGQAVIAGSRG